MQAVATPLPLDCAVTIFAHNEQRTVVAAIHSVLANLPNTRDTLVHVMANGCTDETIAIVSDMATRHTHIRIHKIDLADKSNAWNTYVHDIAQEHQIHYFMDGDVQCSHDALTIMGVALQAAPHANAIGGVPMTGRHRNVYLGYMKRWGWLFANLYAIRGEHLDRIRRARIRLPIGLLGDDHFITRFMQSDLQTPWEERTDRVIYSPRAGYLFPPLQIYNPRHIRLYYRRLVTYRWRQLQLGRIATLPLAILPSTTRDVDRAILQEIRARRFALYDYLTWQVARRIERRHSPG